MSTDNTQSEEEVLWRALRHWLERDRRGAAILAVLLGDPDAGAPALTQWLTVQRGLDAVPQNLATYVVGSRVEKLVNIAYAHAVHIAQVNNVAPIADALLRAYCCDLAVNIPWDDERYIQLKVRPTSGVSQSISVIDATEASSRLLVLGGPGAGKTTSIQYVARVLANRYVRGEGRGMIPVIVPLASYTGDLRASIRGALNSSGIVRASLDQTSLLLEHGNMLLMFDGLNEVPYSTRDGLPAQLSLLFQTYPQHRCLATCRPEDPIWLALPSAVVGTSVQIDVLTAVDIVEFLASRIGPRSARLAFGDLPGEFWDILSSPLLLWMFSEKLGNRNVGTPDAEIRINEAHFRAARLGKETRTKVYTEFIEGILDREGRKGVHATRFTSVLKRSILDDLAFQMQREHVVSQASTTLIGIVRNAMDRNGFMDPPAQILQELRLNGFLLGEEKIRFAHQSFQDYFAARVLARMEDFEDVVYDPWWTESLVFCGGLVDDLVLAGLTGTMARHDPTLAFRCSVEAGQGARATRQALFDNLIMFLGDESWVRRREAVEILGLIGGDNIAEILWRSLDDESQEVRWQAASSLRNFSSKDAAPALRRALMDQHWATRARAAEALGRMHAQDAARDFAPLLVSRYPRERCDATYSLVLLRPDSDDPGLLSLLNAKDELVATAAQLAIDVVSSAEPTTLLQRLLHHEKACIREKSAYLLCRLECAEAIPAIASLLDDPNSDVVIIAMQALAELYAVEYLPNVLEKLADGTPFVRAIASFCCQLFGSRTVVPRLLPLLSDPDSEVRFATARTLGGLGAAESADYLLPLLQDSSERARAEAAIALGVFGSERHLEALSLLVKDPSADARGAGIAAIAEIQRRSDRA
ncbi:HEAT repeat domain-containing protein [Pseudofrankia sp. BMG5.37]|uniref:NACHT domain-containing protein n=1 Tax=Pseudofrankia sp. BMG5.37 TaxID=3050035 RepID=UPI00289614AD|nr:HEAT repeat domain-containing protein [Pseudofrankia sp. BMG5.37]MDT3443597.1 HEAT repeat domain-containing protein [Pseudofrankia sp. BMG5.37]